MAGRERRVLAICIYTVYVSSGGKYVLIVGYMQEGAGSMREASGLFEGWQPRQPFALPFFLKFPNLTVTF